jgi:predicted transcriptional regulator
MIKSVSFSLRIKPKTKKSLEDLACVMRRTKSFIARIALEGYLDSNEWQTKVIIEALKEADSPNVEWTNHTDVKTKRESTRNLLTVDVLMKKKEAELLAIQKVKEAEVLALQLVNEATAKALLKAEGMTETSEEVLVSARLTVETAEVLAHQTVEKARALALRMVVEAETIQSVKETAEVARLKVIKDADIARLRIVKKHQEETIKDLAALLIRLQNEMLILQTAWMLRVSSTDVNAGGLKPIAPRGGEFTLRD